MFGALKTVEDHNMYASFGLIDGLTEDELEEVNGGITLPGGITICFSCNGLGPCAVKFFKSREEIFCIFF